MRLAFVVCPSFHGATLLALLLNNHPELSALGDTLPVRNVSAPGGFSTRCACGKSVGDCPFWQDVIACARLERYVGSRTLLPALPWPLGDTQLEGGSLQLTPSPRWNRRLGAAPAAVVDAVVPALWRVRRKNVAAYAATYASFYRCVLDRHGTNYLVDGSKSWRKAELLRRLLADQADIKVLHLTRDPRGYAASRLRRPSAPDPQSSALLWEHLHARMERLAHGDAYHRVRYEDICSRPQEALDGIFQFLGVSPEPVLAPPRFEHKHHLVGNPMLHGGFDGHPRFDERWRQELTPAQQREVLRDAGELSARFGYA